MKSQSLLAIAMLLAVTKVKKTSAVDLTSKARAKIDVNAESDATGSDSEKPEEESLESHSGSTGSRGFDIKTMFDKPKSAAKNNCWTPSQPECPKPPSCPQPTLNIPCQVNYPQIPSACDLQDQIKLNCNNQKECNSNNWAQPDCKTPCAPACPQVPCFEVPKFEPPKFEMPCIPKIEIPVCPPPPPKQCKEDTSDSESDKECDKPCTTDGYYYSNPVEYRYSNNNGGCNPGYNPGYNQGCYPGCGGFNTPAVIGGGCGFGGGCSPGFGGCSPGFGGCNTGFGCNPGFGCNTGFGGPQWGGNSFLPGLGGYGSSNWGQFGSPFDSFGGCSSFGCSPFNSCGSPFGIGSCGSPFNW